jgi:hypothetical protein
VIVGVGPRFALGNTSTRRKPRKGGRWGLKRVELVVGVVTLFLFDVSYDSGVRDAQDNHSNCCGYGVMRYIITNTPICKVRDKTKQNRTEDSPHHSMLDHSILHPRIIFHD